MNLDALVAIDVHVHAEVAADGHPALPEHLMTGSGRYFKVDGDRMPAVENTIRLLRLREAGDA